MTRGSSPFARFALLSCGRLFWLERSLEPLKQGIKYVASLYADGETRTCNPWITNPSALAIELYSSKAIAGKELSLYPVRILHHYIVIISQLLLTLYPRSTVVLLDTGTPGTSREIK